MEIGFPVDLLFRKSIAVFFGLKNVFELKVFGLSLMAITFRTTLPTSKILVFMLYYKITHKNYRLDSNIESKSLNNTYV